MGSLERTILVTGGAGFIGSHTVIQLLKEGFRVSIIDNLDNSVVEAVDRVRELVGPKLSEKLEFHLVCFVGFCLDSENANDFSLFFRFDLNWVLGFCHFCL